ncbi:AMP-binding, conserved site-containing protein [Artemisia annua]|uniref:AMP-binding, conserved site-containing protein n=1 Tax=Artemisia annua TaxID=35608 RepID=A0A2U1KF72_ARTAN|nr:AMP-binding, conserved site-containing protein [Artemisia annua]
MAGAMLTAINTRLNAKNIATILYHSEAKLAIQLVIVIDDINKPTGVRLGKLEYEQLIHHGNPQYHGEELEDEWDAIALNYTSGTTSDPKGVVYSHYGAFLSTMSLIQGWEMGSKVAYLWSLPMFQCTLIPYDSAYDMKELTCISASKPDYEATHALGIHYAPPDPTLH